MRKRFKEWLEQADVRSELSSAYNSPSNGRCKRLVGQMKSIMAKCKASKECFWTALAEWRLAPRSDGPSPAQLFFRRQVRSGRLPEIHGPLDIQEAIEQKEASQRRSRVRATVRHARPPKWHSINVFYCRTESQRSEALKNRSWPSGPMDVPTRCGLRVGHFSGVSGA